MGKRGSRNRNSNLKKQTQDTPKNTKAITSISHIKAIKPDTEKCNSNEFKNSLRGILKNLIKTFRSRLMFSNEPYYADLSLLPETKCQNLEQVLPCLVNEITEDILQHVQDYCRKLNEFLLESYSCIQSVCTFFEKIIDSESISNITKIIFYCKILKPAWDQDRSLSKNQELRALYKSLHALSKDFNDHSLLPIENIEQLINGTASNKIFMRMFDNSSTDVSSSPNRSIDSEVEELRTRLESCEKLSSRSKPQVSQEWINTLKRQLNKIRI
ncbi:hypothetical protein SteCoe_17854 [Stentor coeruleus]|uniref:Uncharacterized protein n=1 Tax=Stentor coeruleus TaxID=5963 RepID=A0A1R2BXV3_9CILI|nr:hypothetical protein SteCoe_17854 [Stentor coeruleus]